MPTPVDGLPPAPGAVRRVITFATSAGAIAASGFAKCSPELLAAREAACHAPEGDSPHCATLVVGKIGWEQAIPLVGIIASALDHPVHDLLKCCLGITDRIANDGP